MSIAVVDGAGVVAPAGKLVKPPTSSVPPLVWMIDSMVALIRRPLPANRLVLMVVENGASSTVGAVIVLSTRSDCSRSTA